MLAATGRREAISAKLPGAEGGHPRTSAAGRGQRALNILGLSHFEIGSELA